MKTLRLFQGCLVSVLLVLSLAEAKPGPKPEPRPGPDAQSLWENFSRPNSFPKQISTTVKPVNPDQDQTGFWSKMASGSKAPDLPDDRPEDPEETESSPIDLLSKFANFRAMQKYSQLASNPTTSTSTFSPTSVMLTPDSENGLVRRMGSAAPVSDRREESEFDANSAMNVDDVDIIDVDDDDSDADGGRLVAQVTAVNVLSQVQRMQDEIKELNEQIEEENMKAKLKDLKKSMMEPEGKSSESSNI